MTTRELALAYLLAGAACAVAVYRRSTSGRGLSALSAALTLPLWPLWAPFALLAEGEGARGGEAGLLEARIERTLGQTAALLRGTPLEPLLPAESVAKIRCEVGVVVARVAQLGRHVRLADEGDERGRRGVPGAGAAGAGRSPRRSESAQRMKARFEAALGSLEELADILDALRMELAAAQLGGMPGERAESLLCEVWVRLDGLRSPQTPPGG